MSNSSLGHKEQKSQLHEIHTTFRSRDIGQNNKRSLTFCTRVKFSSWSNFNETGLKLIRLSCRFRKCIVSYTLDTPILVYLWFRIDLHADRRIWNACQYKNHCRNWVYNWATCRATTGSFLNPTTFPFNYLW